ncbi:MAG TPA: beta-propeller fold lactonase family protein [Solirubrobacterales bacterium]|nr:beta-propeller fold lactonase family protein [Solirubrobacterales bacterium]
MRRLVPLALVLCMLAWAASAQAATGDLTFKDCLAKFATGPCSAVPDEVLEGARYVAVSPDGRFVYVADYTDSIVVFKRSLATGAISFASCIDNGGDAGCTHLPVNTLQAPRRLAFSPDGASLYVAAETSDAIVRLSVAADGSLSFASCVEDDDLFDSGCGQKAGTLDGPTRVVVSPDGKSVYSVSNDYSLNHFSAALAPQSCYREVTVSGCSTQAQPLQAASGLAISPDGKFLYVTSVGRDAIAWFKREEGGTLSFVACTDDGDVAEFTTNCTEDTGVDYNFLNHITLSPDGSSAYVTDETGLGAVYHFSRDALTGALTRKDCFADDLNVDAPGCTELDESTGTGLSSVTDAVVSPDAANLYTVAFQDSALSTFGLASPSGTMSFIRCLRANEFQGCAGFGPSVLDGPFGVDVSPDGHDVYVANGSGVPALLHFEREAPGTRPGEEGEEPEEPGPEEPGPGTGTGSGGSGSGSTSPPNSRPTPSPSPNTPGPVVKCGGFKATKVGTARADTIKGTPKKDVIAAGAGNDKVSALGGKDIVCGEGGNDQLGGGPGDDLLLGGPGRDTLLGNGGVDRFVGGPGRDSVKQ